MNRFKFLVMTSGILLSLPVQAGFQFTGPVNQPAQPQVGGLLPAPDVPTIQTQMPAVPAAPVIRQSVATPVTPIIPQSQPQPQPIARPAQTPMQAPVQTQAPIRWNANPATAPAVAMPVASPKTEFDMAVGFGDDVPLAVALQQVIPQNYTHTIDPQLSQGRKVSWQGGRAWPDVLDDMVQPLGMQARLQGNNVVITGPTAAPVRSPRINQVASLSQGFQPQSQMVQNDAIPQAPMNQSVPQFQPQPLMAAASTPTNIMHGGMDAVDVSVQTTEAKEDDMGASVIPDVTMGQWSAQNGTSLKTVLESWSNLEGVDLFWSSDFDYPLNGDVNISGAFEEAVEILLSGFSDAKPKPVGRLHPNLPHGPAVLLIETKQVIN